MPAYFVYICQEVFDRAELEIYWKEIGSTLEGYEVKNLAAYTHFEHLEGDDVEGVALVEFPSIEEARRWYTSEAYRQVRKHRQNGARYIGLLVESGAMPIDERMPNTKSKT